MSNTGAIGFSLDSPVNLRETSKIVPGNIVLIGNLAPVKIFLQSTPEEITKGWCTKKFAI